MHYLVNSQEMKTCDKNTIEYYGIPSLVLMERAALAVFEEIKKRFPDKNTRILVMCGSGNNGGDGFALARLLFLEGYFTEVIVPMDKEKMTPETKMQYHTLLQYGITEISDHTAHTYDVIVDALFGIGLCRNIEGGLKELLTVVNERNTYKIAVDISSGIDADNGKVLGIAFLADLTVTFGFAKIGHLLFPGAKYTKELIVADIGIDERSFFKEDVKGRYLTISDAQNILPTRKQYTNKGSYGKLLVIAGSKKMAGAAYLAAKAAYYSGCGYVRIFTAKENRDILLTKLPEALLTTYDVDKEDTDSILASLDQCLKSADTVLIGPGLDTDHYAKSIVSKVLEYSDKKVVLDADALNILAQDIELLKMSNCQKIITPHLGEMSRLLKCEISEIQENLISCAGNFAKDYGLTCILKDARTIIGSSAGEFYINVSGNNGMATAGSGDVLAGLLTGIWAQQDCAPEAAALSCYLHGMAGEFAAKEKGTHSMLASDILENIPAVILKMANGGV